MGISRVGTCTHAKNTCDNTSISIADYVVKFSKIYILLYSYNYIHNAVLITVGF